MARSSAPHSSPSLARLWVHARCLPRLVNNPSYPEFVRDFEATFATLHALPCDIFFAPHGGQFAMAEKFARLERGGKDNPFIDPIGWEKLIAGAEKAFRDQLATERAAAN